MATIFSKILAGDLPCDLVYEDEQCIAFRDINPVAPMHILVIPREEIAQLDAASPQDTSLLGHLMHVAARVAHAEGYPNFRCIINNGAGAGQTVFHLHIHVIGGRPLSWPPG